MPKSIPVSPEHFRKVGTLAFPQIPLHAYARPFAEERKARGEKALVEILRHMMIIREFESMLGAFKAKGSYQDITFAYRGPAHLSIGQEAAAVIGRQVLQYRWRYRRSIDLPAALSTGSHQ